MTSADQQRFEVLLERIESKVNAVAEGQEATNERLDRLEGRMDRVETKLDHVAMDVGSLKGNMVRVKTRLARIEDHLRLNGTPAKRSPRRRQSSNRRMK